ncbi:E1 ubiquitin-activating protein aos1, partial [Coemansia sp. Benny D115]
MSAQEETRGMSKEEIALYDRQIRLWGMEAQARMRSASIKFLGIKALTLEVCKNLVLAGLGKIILQDPTPICTRDLETLYYLQPNDLGKPKDQVIAERLRILNPLVDILVGDEKEYQVLVVVGNSSIPMEVAKECRELGRQFVKADCFGLFGYIFIDALDKHEYVDERKDGDEIKREKLVEHYCSLEESLGTKVEAKNLTKLLRQYPSLAFISQALTATEVSDKAEREEMERA